MSKELQLALDGVRRERAAAQQRVETLDVAVRDLERTIASLRPQDQQGQGQELPQAQAQAQAATGPKPFAGVTLRDAAEQILKGAPAPMPTRQLCNQLLAGGFQTTARNFYMVVYAGLKGMPNFTRTVDGAWLWQDGAKAGSYQTKAVAKAKGAGR